MAPDSGTAAGPHPVRISTRCLHWRHRVNRIVSEEAFHPVPRPSSVYPPWDLGYFESRISSRELSVVLNLVFDLELEALSPRCAMPAAHDSRGMWVPYRRHRLDEIALAVTGTPRRSPDSRARP